MSAYLIRRAASSIIILIGISLLTFGMLHIIGGPPGRVVLGLKASPAAVQRFNVTHGYFKPFLIQVFAISFPIFPASASASVSQNSSLVGAITDPRAMVLPVLTLTLTSVAGYSRYMRSSAIDALAQDYIKA